jgi:hypothetical protein
VSLRLIGDEIEWDGQIVGIIVPHARPGPRDDFEAFLRDVELDQYDAAEQETGTFDELEARIGNLKLFGGMVPIVEVLAAIKEAKTKA